MPKKIKRNQNQAVLYIRVSSDKQAVSGLGLADQTKRCEDYCRLMGLEIVGTFRDEGVSAGKPLATRPAGKDLVDTLKRSGAGCVVTLKLDRAFRSALDALATVEHWERLGVALHMVDFGGSTVDTSTPAGKMFLTMMAGFAEFERGLIADRTRSAMAVKKRNGQRVGRIPFGKQLGSDGKILFICPEEAKTIVLMKKFHSLESSLRKTARLLNESGNDNRGNPWTKSAVHRILSR